MPTQMNHECCGKGYKTASHAATISHAQTAHDGGRTTKKGGGNASKPQMNHTASISVPKKFCKSHGKSNTGCAKGY